MLCSKQHLPSLNKLLQPASVKLNALKKHPKLQLFCQNFVEDFMRTRNAGWHIIEHAQNFLVKIKACRNNIKTVT